MKAHDAGKLCEITGSIQMLRIAFAVMLAATIPFTAFAGPKEEAQAVADKFITAFVAGDLEATTALFAPDASFWGTVSPDLGTSPEVVRKYFTDNYAARAAVPLKGIAFGWHRDNKAG